jgi:hypothetical protein
VSGFSNAQPSKLRAPFRVMIAHWLLSGEASCCGKAARGPLARVRHLRLFSYVPTHPEMASVLRAAPELRILDAGLLLRDTLDWADDAAFEGLIHPRLRSIRVATARALSDAEYDLLQQRHFPRLQEVLFEATAA